MKTKIKKLAVAFFCAQAVLPSQALLLLRTAWAEELRIKNYNQQLPELFTPGTNETMVASKNEALEISQELNRRYFSPTKGE